MNPSPTTKISIVTRLSSMLLDHTSACIIMALIMAPVIMITVFQDFTSNEPPQLSGLDPQAMYLFPLAFTVYFAKDSIDGPSIAKRITKLQVVTAKTGETANPIRCCIRNLPIVIWPLEILFTFFNTSRKMGDWIAGTRIVNYSHEKVKSSVRWQQLIVALLIGYIFAFLLLEFMDNYLF